MAVFGEYAELYDMFYKDKDYSLETDYILSLLKEYSKSPVRTILDVGCGTGGHALVWAASGIDVTGLDLSSAMLERARRKAMAQGQDIEFIEGDVRSFDLKRSFDTVVAMFAVMSYLISDADIEAAFRSVRSHLKPGGLFIFDAWSGPGVLSVPPTDRVGYFERDGIEIVRTVRPEHDMKRHVVDVHYDILCIKGDRILKRIREVHQMRYLFSQEVADFASRSGFELVTSEPFMKKDEGLRMGDWNAMFVMRAV